MTQEQQYYLEMYKAEAEKAYVPLHDYRIEYDTYKPVADANILLTNESKKILEYLYPIYINYPVFLKKISDIYLEFKSQSDESDLILNEKQNNFLLYKSYYDNWINKINALEVQIDEDELSKTIEEIANLPESLIRSDEFVLIEEEKARVAEEQRIATELAKPKILEDQITGRQVCVDKYGNEIDMGICRPSSPAAQGVPSTEQVKSPIALVNENIDNWLMGIQSALNPIKKEDTYTTSSSTSIPNADTQIEAKPEEAKPEEAKPEEAKVEEAKVEEQIGEKDNEIVEEKSEALNDIVNSFVFGADLSKIIEDEKASREKDTQKESEALNDIVNSFVLGDDLSKITEDEEANMEKINLPTIDELSSEKASGLPVKNKKEDNLSSIFSNKNNIILLSAVILVALVGYKIIKKDK